MSIARSGRMPALVFSSFLVLNGLAVAPAYAEHHEGGQSPAFGDQDAQYLQHQAEANTAASEATRMALERIRDPHERAIPEQLLKTEHQTRTDIDRLAQRDRIELHANDLGEFGADVQHLRAVSGPQFGTAYADFMTHRFADTVIRWSRDENVAGHDALVRNLAKKINGQVLKEKQEVESLNRTS